MSDVFYTDNDEVEFAALALDSAGVASPVRGLSWLQAWSQGLVKARTILDAADERLGPSS